MDPFSEFRTPSSSQRGADAFSEFRPQRQASPQDAFSEFRASSSSSSSSPDAFPEFRVNLYEAQDAFREFRPAAQPHGRDEFAEFRSPSSNGLFSIRKMFKRKPHLGIPIVEEVPHSEDLLVTVPLPDAEKLHAGNVHVQLHSSNIVIEALSAPPRSIKLPCAVSPDADASLKDGKLSITLHKCASPNDRAVHNIIVH
ncbi:hypothetical protein AURDEDRAFT_154559 [Auricularia subglabra TFB-10046 SS5]|nr:hypothetical protein AURDEDRAFT_154559 [Auricularia subglabra TFB-10046 SS5]